MVLSSKVLGSRLLRIDLWIQRTWLPTHRLSLFFVESTVLVSVVIATLECVVAFQRFWLLCRRLCAVDHLSEIDSLVPLILLVALFVTDLAAGLPVHADGSAVDVAQLQVDDVVSLTVL